MRRGAGAAVGALVWLAGVAPVSWAQDQQPPGQPSPEQQRRLSGIESITVTAEKREADLQDTGLSIQAFSSADLDRMGLDSTHDFSNLVPGLTFVAASQNPGQLAISGRGLIHADNHPMQPQTVGIYLDDVYLGNGDATLFDLIDVESVEFLKGPQGTLFGRNTIGGAVVIRSAKPTPEFGGKIKVRAGQYKRRDVLGTLNFPILGETMMGRISFARQLQDGFWTNDTPGKDWPFNDLDSKAFRGALRWLLTEDLTADYSFNWLERREHMRLSISHENHTAVPCATPNLFCDAFGRQNVAAIPGANFLTNTPGTLVPSRLIEYDRHDTDQRYYYGGKDGGDQNRNTWDHSLSFNWDISDNMALKLSNGWHRNKMAVTSDQDGTPFAFADFGTDEFARSYNSELQLSGTLLDGSLNYVLGGTWWQENYDMDQYGDVYLDVPTLPLISTARNKGESHAIGIYNQWDFRPIERLELTAGLRYSTERKEVTRDLCNGRIAATVPATINAFHRAEPSNCRLGDGADSNVPPDGIADIIFDRKYHARFDSWTPLFRVKYDWTDSLMTYVKWAKGFNAGGFGPRAANASAQATAPYEPELLYSWEVGFKSRWWDNRLQFNGAGFYDEHDDQQVAIFIPGQGVATSIQNAGKSRIRGFEFDVRALPFEGLEVLVNHAWTYATFSEFESINQDFVPNPSGVCPSGQALIPGISQCFFVRGPFFGQLRNGADSVEFAHLPKRKWGGMIRYTFPQFSWGTLEILGSFTRESPRNNLSNDAQNQYIQSSAYTVYDGRIALYDAFGVDGLSFAFVGKNLSDRVYFDGQGIDFNPLGWVTNRMSEPRRFYLELEYDFM
jgi:iron complex outermembrane receptor protein